MKNYILINGKTVITFTADDMEAAKKYAVSIVDCSKEIILREISMPIIHETHHQS